MTTAERVFQVVLRAIGRSHKVPLCEKADAIRSGPVGGTLIDNGNNGNPRANTQQ